MDVFSTRSLQDTHYFLDSLSLLGFDSEYNASTLNASHAIINQSLESLEESTDEPDYLIASISTTLVT